ncbi:MAG TPA: hydroxymethylglutaryl-CoA lyase [Thermomicrobiales bacterium]|nr:hydroxymethylglutaryl-CoA lyase [Thermomicrobiales bacterium]
MNRRRPRLSATERRIIDRLPGRVAVYEVGPRDGLQNEATAVPAAAKVAFVNELADAGLAWIETTSFVNPRAVPQLADAAEVMAGIDRREGVRYPALVPNEQGMERALACGVDCIALFAAASEAFSQANIRVGIDASFERFEPVARLAKQNGVWLRGYVSTAFHCPYSGPVDPEQAVVVAGRLFEIGCDEVAIADTIGVATPLDVDRLLRIAIPRLPIERLAMHFHDTTDLALANVVIALEAGITVFDGAAGGLGGCPFAPGAPGNLATEKLVRLLDGLGVASGVDAAMVGEAGRRMRALLSNMP